MRRLEQRGAVAFTAMGVAVVVILHVVILLITLWGLCSRGRRAAPMWFDDRDEKGEHDPIRLPAKRCQAHRRTR